MTLLGVDYDNRAGASGCSVAGQCRHLPKVSAAAPRALSQVSSMRMICSLAFQMFELVAILALAESELPKTNLRNSVHTPGSEQTASAHLPGSLAYGSELHGSIGADHFLELTSESNSLPYAKTSSAFSGDYGPGYFSKHGAGVRPSVRKNGNTAEDVFGSIAEDDGLFLQGRGEREAHPGPSGSTSGTAKQSPGSRKHEGDNFVAFEPSGRRAAHLDMSWDLPRNSAEGRLEDRRTNQTGTVSSPVQTDSDSWPSTTSAVASILLAAYLYFTIRVTALSRCCCSCPQLKSETCNPRSAASPANGATESALLGKCEPEWMLRGWTGTTIAALSGLGEPWTNVLEIASRLRQERRKLAYQKLEEPASRFPCCSACADRKTPPFKNSHSAEESGFSLCSCGSALCWEAVGVLGGTNVPEFSETTSTDATSSSADTEHQHFCAPLDCFASPGTGAAEQELADQQTIRLAATYMQDRTFVWWGTYFASSCVFILFVLSRTLQADHELLPTTRALLGVTLPLPSSWCVLSAIQWCSSVCLLYGLVSDYHHATNGSFQNKHRVRLNAAVGIFSMAFLVLIFSGPRPSTVCLVGGFHTLPGTEADFAPSSHNTVSLQAASAGGEEMPGRIASSHEPGEGTTKSRTGQGLVGERELSEDATILNPYINGGRGGSRVIPEYRIGNRWSDEGSSCGEAACWFIVAVACYGCIRLIGVGLILSVVTNEYRFLEKKDSQAAISFSWLVAGLAFSFVDILPFPMLRVLLRERPLANAFPLTGVDVLLCAQCVCNFFFFKHVHRELLYATRPSIKDAIRAMQDTFRLRNFD